MEELEEFFNHVTDHPAYVFLILLNVIIGLGAFLMFAFI